MLFCLPCPSCRHFPPSFHYLLSIQSVPSTPLIRSVIPNVLYLLPFHPNSFHMPIKCLLFLGCNSLILAIPWDSSYQIIRLHHKFQYILLRSIQTVDHTFRNGIRGQTYFIHFVSGRLCKAGQFVVSPPAAPLFTYTRWKMTIAARPDFACCLVSARGVCRCWSDYILKRSRKTRMFYKKN